MPKPKDYIPLPSKHRSGQAVVRLNGRDVYLGKHGREEAKAEYNRVIAEWLANGRQLPSSDADGPTVNEVILGFVRHAEGYYVKNGQQTDEVDCIKSAIRPLRELYGRELAGEFRPLKLQAVRHRMIELGWSRRYINKSVDRIRRAFKWAVANELITAPGLLEALRAVEGLKQGRSAARETPPRKPVPQEHLDAVRQLVPQWVRDLIDLQLHSAARPGELFVLTVGMIDRGGPVWTARLEDHKTAHAGKRRVLFLGPKAQMILRRYLGDDPEARLFGRSLWGYWNRIKLACEGAGIPRWSPHWLRHTALTRIREEHGAEAAQVIAGHSKLDTTEIYAQKNLKLGESVIAKVG